ncbi:hypothetical protein S7711_06236 [Stachybotrys chartarum IBT 7711]|uniref:Uncharacterized protein n=1 Tax=Stachybotrys chartarum (strain CBS 109288 / IBT 7711) TaxID=1280523 RepID=A0A084AWD0_STACB|nr:hypothetical protein S7711_06236 [Stachybotrys chartarum IBT 7711]
MPELEPYEDGVYLWHYVPSRAASIVFLCAFALCTLCIVIRMIWTRTWFSIPFIIGGLMEVAGFVARALSYTRTGNLSLYSVQFILILVAPALFAASVYMALSRLIRKLNARAQSIISPRWLTRIFVLGDVISFVVQLAGGAMATNPDGNPNTAKWVILIGLLVQIGFFGLFMLTALVFNLRFRALGPPRTTTTGISWTRILYMLYSVSALVMGRSIFRVIEYAMGVDSYLFQHEWPLYSFDAALMLLAMITWGLLYPGDLNLRSQINRKTFEEIQMNRQADYGVTQGPSHQPPHVEDGDRF